jgi:hypothetical protein
MVAAEATFKTAITSSMFSSGCFGKEVVVVVRLVGLNLSRGGVSLRNIGEKR